MCYLEQNKKLASTFPRLVYNQEKLNYNTRSVRKNLLDIPLRQTFTYGMQSCKYHNNALKIRTDSKRKTQLRTKLILL